MFGIEKGIGDAWEIEYIQRFDTSMMNAGEPNEKLFVRLFQQLDMKKDPNKYRN